MQMESTSALHYATVLLLVLLILFLALLFLLNCVYIFRLALFSKEVRDKLDKYLLILNVPVFSPQFTVEQLRVIIKKLLL